MGTLQLSPQVRFPWVPKHGGGQEPWDLRALRNRYPRIPKHPLGWKYAAWPASRRAPLPSRTPGPHYLFAGFPAQAHPTRLGHAARRAPSPPALEPPALSLSLHTPGPAPATPLVTPPPCSPPGWQQGSVAPQPFAERRCHLGPRPEGCPREESGGRDRDRSDWKGLSRGVGGPGEWRGTRGETPGLQN